MVGASLVRCRDGSSQAQDGVIGEIGEFGEPILTILGRGCHQVRGTGLRPRSDGDRAPIICAAGFRPIKDADVTAVDVSSPEHLVTGILADMTAPSHAAVGRSAPIEVDSAVGLNVGERDTDDDVVGEVV